MGSFLTGRARQQAARSLWCNDQLIFQTSKARCRRQLLLRCPARSRAGTDVMSPPSIPQPTKQWGDCDRCPVGSSCHRQVPRLRWLGPDRVDANHGPPSTTELAISLSSRLVGVASLIAAIPPPSRLPWHFGLTHAFPFHRNGAWVGSVHVVSHLSSLS